MNRIDEATNVAIQLKYYSLKKAPSKESFEKGVLVKAKGGGKRKGGAGGEGEASGGEKKRRGRPRKGVEKVVDKEEEEGVKGEVKEECEGEF